MEYMRKHEKDYEPRQVGRLVVHRRFARLGSFTVHGSRRVSREESVHGSRFTDSGWGLVGSRFGVHGLGAGASWFTVHGSRFRRELRGLLATMRTRIVIVRLVHAEGHRRRKSMFELGGTRWKKEIKNKKFGW